MKTRTPSRRKGSALLTVVMLTAIMAVLTGSMLKYTLSERKGNERNRVIQRAKNMSENISLYAAEQITTKLYRLRSASSIAFMTGSNAINLPPTSLLQTVNSSYTAGNSAMEVRAGLTTSTGLVFINPATDPTNANAGLQVNTANVPIIAKATATHSAIGSITSYTQNDLAVDFVPLFQFAVFYNMDMEIWPGADMTLAGPVHTNGELSARSAQGFTAAISFLDRVSTAKGFYTDANRQGPWYQSSGAVQTGAGGDGPVTFKHSTSGTTTAIKSSGGVWRDHKYGNSTETATTINNFKVFATTNYGLNLRTTAHGVSELVLPSVSGYAKTDDTATSEDERDNGRQLIATPSASDTAGLKETRIGRKAGLYIVVNPDDETRTGYLPDGSAVSMRARSYRCWLNTVNSDLTHTISEVVLPGQPSYGALNATANLLPNSYRMNSSVGHNQVLRTIKGGGVDFADTGYSPDSDVSTTAGIQAPAMSAFGDAYFYDLRRATGNTGAGSQSSTGTTRSGNPYTPRPIVKVDLDLTRFRMMVERTMAGATSSTIYYPSRPNDTTTWNASIFNSSGAQASFGLGLAIGTDTAFTTFPTTASSITVLQRSQAAAYAPATLSIGSNKQTGTGTIDAYPCRFKIETSSDNGATFPTTAYTSSANESTYSYTPTQGVTHLRVSQYAPGGTTDLLDQQILPVVPDLAPLGISCAGGYVTGRFIIAESTTAAPAFGTAWSTSGWTDRYTSGADEGSTTFHPTPTATAIRVRQYLAGGTSTLVNEQIIPMVTAALTNDRFILPVTSSTSFSTTNFTDAITEMRVFVGGEDDTENWTFSASTTGSVAGAFSTIGRLKSRYAATSISSASGTTTGTVTITATKGSISIARVFTIVKQSSLGGGTNSPAQTGYWLSFQSNPDPFRLYYTSGTAVSSTDLVSTSTSRPWFDGITVYVQSVDAEVRGDGADADTAPDRIDSGIRLWNGRGPIVSLDGTTYPGRTGFTFCTNDAAYIVGHFNADGSINSTSTSTTNPGGYSATYPDSSSEKLCSVMADAVTILSQPVFSSTAPYNQSTGWTDSLSANRTSSSGWSSSWQTIQPSGSNGSDGINRSFKPASMPNFGSTVQGGGSAVDVKLDASTTEVSTALVVGIVPTNHNPTGLTDGAPSTGANGQASGGLHNFPRLLEIWGSANLYIRGSMVAMYESRVAMEPWNLRVYSAPARTWGLHNGFKTAGHDLPLEPILLGARRLGFKEITAAEYATMKATIEALPH